MIGVGSHGFGSGVRHGRGHGIGHSIGNGHGRYGLGHGYGYGGYGLGHGIGFGYGHGGYGLGHGYGYDYGLGYGIGFGYGGYGYYSPYYYPYYGSYGAYAYPTYYDGGYGATVYYDDSYTYSPVIIEDRGTDNADDVSAPEFLPERSRNSYKQVEDERSDLEGLVVPRPLVIPDEAPEVLPSLNNGESSGHSHDEEKSDATEPRAGAGEEATRT